MAASLEMVHEKVHAAAVVNANVIGGHLWIPVNNGNQGPLPGEPLDELGGPAVN